MEDQAAAGLGARSDGNVVQLRWLANVRVEAGRQMGCPLEVDHEAFGGGSRAKQPPSDRLSKATCGLRIETEPVSPSANAVLSPGGKDEDGLPTYFRYVRIAKIAAVAVFAAANKELP